MRNPVKIPPLPQENKTKSQERVRGDGWSLAATHVPERRFETRHPKKKQAKPDTNTTPTKRSKIFETTFLASHTYLDAVLIRNVPTQKQAKCLKKYDQTKNTENNKTMFKGMIQFTIHGVVRSARARRDIARAIARSLLDGWKGHSYNGLVRFVVLKRVGERVVTRSHVGKITDRSLTDY